MVEALVKLRDYSEKRIAPACQRVHIVLEEIHGWSQLLGVSPYSHIATEIVQRPEFGAFELDGEEIKTCLDHASRAIVITSWLASVVRREMARFKEFIKWLSYGNGNH